MSTKIRLSFVRLNYQRETVSVPSHEFVEEDPLSPDRKDVVSPGKGGNKKKFSTEEIKNLLLVRWFS